MSQKYDFQTLKKAILFNTVEVLPTDEKQLDEEIKVLVEEANKSNKPIRHYIGFEISGQIHIGTGMMTALKIKALQDAGVACSIFLADYHTYLNNKLDGSLETIRKVAKTYFGSVMLKCCEIVGCDVEKVEIVYAEELYKKQVNNQDILSFYLSVSKQLTLNRVIKSITVTGKEAGENVEFGLLMYPPLQVADAFFMQTHLVHAGIDQRKCHVLMREVAGGLAENFALKINDKKIKPIAIHHHLLLSLGVTAEDAKTRMDSVAAESLKMSKSKPDSAVWVTDSYDEIFRKLKKAYCPIPDKSQTLEEIKEAQNLNPVLNWCKNLIFAAHKEIKIERKPEWGGDLSYSTYQDLEKDYFAGNLHPLDLKTGVAKCLADWFSPICEYVKQNPEGLELIIKSRK